MSARIETRETKRLKTSIQQGAQTRQWEHLPFPIHQHCLTFLDLEDVCRAAIVDKVWYWVSKKVQEGATRFVLRRALVKKDSSVAWLKWTNRFAQVLPRLQTLIVHTSVFPSLKRFGEIIATHPQLDALCFDVETAGTWMYRSSPRQIQRVLTKAFTTPGHAPLRSWCFATPYCWREGVEPCTWIVKLLQNCSGQGQFLEEFRWTTSRGGKMGTFDLVTLVRMPRLHTLDLRGLGFTDEVEPAPVIEAMLAKEVPWRFFKFRYILSPETALKFASKTHLHLQHLHIGVPREKTSEAVLLSVARACPNLVELCIEGSDALSDTGLEQLVTVACPRLQILDLDIPYQDAPNSKLDVLTLTIAPQLIHLSLMDCICATMDQALAFFQAAKQLQSCTNLVILDPRDQNAIKFQTRQASRYGDDNDRRDPCVFWQNTEYVRDAWSKIQKTPYGSRCKYFFDWNSG